MVGGQAGQALGALAREVVGSCDIGLPLAPDGVGALLPAGVSAFGEGLELSTEEVRLYLALREAAHQRLFAHVPWLRAYVLGAVEDYARGITVDLSGIEQAVAGLDLSDPEALQRALGGEISLQPEETPQQKAALARLETALALIEGWVDTVVNQVAEGRLPGAVKLAEAVRRRRATGGPAERTFATLVGLELRPRRLREAGALWRALTQARGVEGRDAVWGHPDLMPTAADLDDPDGFVHGRPETSGLSDLDLSKLTDGLDEGTGGERGDKGDPGADGPSEGS
jgi:putative hydrolase